MATLSDIAKLTKKHNIRGMAVALYYLNPLTISTRELFRFAWREAAPKEPQDLSPQGRIDPGLHYMTWTDAGAGTMHRADSFDLWISESAGSLGTTINVKEPQWGLNFNPNTSVAFGVQARNAFGLSGQAVADFNTFPSGGGNPPTPQPVTGYSRLGLQNCDSEHHTLSIYLQDKTVHGDWYEAGSIAAQYDSSGGCPNGPLFTVSLIDGHDYNWVIVDPLAIGCSDPVWQTYGCWKAGPGTVHGSASGGVFPVSVP